MAENLKTTSYNDESAINPITDNAQWSTQNEGHTAGIKTPKKFIRILLEHYITGMLSARVTFVLQDGKFLLILNTCRCSVTLGIFRE